MKTTTKKEFPSLTADLEFEEIMLPAFTACGSGELNVKWFVAKGNERGFSLRFVRNGKEQRFAVYGFAAKKLAAYIALWA